MSFEVDRGKDDEALKSRHLALPTRWEALVLAVAAAVLCGLWWSGKSAGDGILGFRLDDAWIHMVYGREIASRGYPAYNPGIPATGSSAPLWAYWVAVLHLALGSQGVAVLVLASFASNLILWLGVVLLGMRIARDLTGSVGIALGTGLCLAFATTVAAAAYSGMEVLLCAFLLLAGARALLRSRPGWAGAMLGLACLTRPESAICALVGAGWILASRAKAERSPRSTVASLLRYAVPLLILGTAALTFNLVVSGHALPATFYLKTQAVSTFPLSQRVSRLFVDLLGHVPMFDSGLVWLGALGFFVARGWSGRGQALVVFIMGLAYAIATVLVVPPFDPAAFYHQRYVFPAAPLLIVALFVTSSQLVPRSSPRLARMLPTTLCLATMVAGALSIGAVSRHLHSDTRNINQVQRQLGLWVDQHLPAKAWIATNDAGAIRYFSNRPALDMMGLNTPRLIWEPGSFARAYPVEVAIVMPFWFSVVGQRPMHELTRAITTNYTVTSLSQMRQQSVLELCGATTTPSPVDFRGAKHVTLFMVPAPCAELSGNNEAPRSKTTAPSANQIGMRPEGSLAP